MVKEYHASTDILHLCECNLRSPFQRKMIVQDKLEKERNDAKNAVEEYVYDLRDKLCGIYEKFITEDVRKSALSSLITASNSILPPLFVMH